MQFMTIEMAPDWSDVAAMGVAEFCCGLADQVFVVLTCGSYQVTDKEPDHAIACIPCPGLYPDLYDDAIASYMIPDNTIKDLVFGLQADFLKRLNAYEAWEEENMTARLKITLDNMDRLDGSVLVTSHDAAGAREDQSIMGSMWECDGDDFAYAIISDRLDLAKALKEAGYNVDNDFEYFPFELAEEGGES